MKKYILVLVLLVFPFFARAAVPDGTYFFMDNKGYDVNGTQTFFCFEDGSCYTIEGVLTFTRDISNKIDQLTQTIGSLQDTINQLHAQVSNLPVTPTSTPPVVIVPNIIVPPVVDPNPDKIKVAYHFGVDGQTVIVDSSKLIHIKSFTYSLIGSVDNMQPQNLEITVNGQNTQLGGGQNNYLYNGLLPFDYSESSGEYLMNDPINPGTLVYIKTNPVISDFSNQFQVTGITYQVCHLNNFNVTCEDSDKTFSINN